MKTENKTPVTVEITVNTSIEKVWEYWTKPEHITKWNNASDDWYTRQVENDLREGGKFSSRMEAKDGSSGFDFEGVYNVVRTHQNIEYTMGDGRKVKITFTPDGNKTHLAETFDPETNNAIEMQRVGWQAILDNFKKYTEAQ